MGGTIGMDRIGKNTVFWFVVPVTTPAVAAKEGVNSSHDEGHSSHASHANSTRVIPVDQPLSLSTPRRVASRISPRTQSDCVMHTVVISNVCLGFGW